MSDHVIDDATTMKRVAMVVVVLLGVTAGLLIAVSLIT